MENLTEQETAQMIEGLLTAADTRSTKGSVQITERHLQLQGEAQETVRVAREEESALNQRIVGKGEPSRTWTGAARYRGNFWIKEPQSIIR